MPSKGKKTVGAKVSYRRADDLERFAVKNGLTVNKVLCQLIDLACLGGVAVERGEIVIHGDGGSSLDTSTFERHCRKVGRDPQQTLDYIAEQI